MNIHLSLSRFLLPFCLAACLLSVHAAETNAVKVLKLPDVVEACLNGTSAVVQSALDQGFDVNTADPNKRTPLMYAAFNGHLEVVQLLLAAGADVNLQEEIGTSALMFAASGPSTETVKALLTAGAKINMTDNNEHFTALMWAAAEGQTANVRLLLDHKADLTLTDIDGDTAASFAAKAGHAAAAQMLKEAASKSAEK